MRLPPQETERFYRIWFALLHYVNSQLHLVPAFPATCDEEQVSTDIVIQLRDALWANDALREQFIADNPAQLSAADLALVASWQYRVAGTFYIFRSLQKYTIFLSETTPTHAYGVLGLVSSIEETVPLPLPVYTNAVLLPFGHEIIYDSLLISYNVVFGSGIRRELQETYRAVQEREGIMTSLLPEDHLLADRSKDISTRNRKVLTAFRRELGKAGLSTHMIEVHAHTIEDFSQTVLLHAEPPRGILDLTLADIQSYLNEKPGKQPVTSFKRFVRFLINTGRIDYEVGEEIYDVLKQMSKGS
ncbi:MAG TPA: hypothetical protein VKY19_23025 [Ktedonosporobacter sp.]|jgi:hypothetical protein|nr:hypothetical protein [Ktedonosporobacter sp.]